MEYEHKGVKITFDAERGQFSARLAGENVRVASLVAMKKRIDKAQGFEAFDALAKGSWTNKTPYIKVRIVAVKKPTGKSSWSNRPKWIDESGREHDAVCPYTPENEAAINAREKLRARHREEKVALDERHEVEMNEADAKVVTSLPA